MTKNTYKLLFLCTGNAAHSIPAEAILNRTDKGRFRAGSASRFSRGEVYPSVLHLLKHLNHPIDQLRSKSWDEFIDPVAPRIDFVFTAFDKAVAETCLIWFGQPMTTQLWQQLPLDGLSPDRRGQRQTE